MATFEQQLHIELGKIKDTYPSKSQTKHAMKEALRVSPPTKDERDKFLKTQKPEGREIFLQAEKERALQTSITKPKNVMYGLGIGAGAMLLLGAPLLLPIAAAGGAFYIYKKHKPGVMTPERKKIYDEALKSLKDPVKLRMLADTFEKEGFSKEADLLRKRAGLKELPAPVVKERRAALKKGLKSSNVHGVEKLASTFEGEGATGAAEQLRIHAAALKSL